MKGKLPLLLSIILFLLIFFLRLNQGGFEAKLNLFSTQRAQLDERISRLLPSPQAQLLSGIILGNKTDLPADLKLNLRDTSTLHIVVVSGQNLTMLAGVTMFLLSGILHKRLAISLSFILIVFYTLLTGAQIPVLRAAVMAGLSLTAQFFGRQKEALWLLIVTAAMMLLINPKWLFDLSFQLSFLATFGVVVVAPMLNKLLEKRLPSLISQDLSVTTAAQIMVTPFIIQSFHQFSIVGIATNLMVGWIIPLIMILGMIMIFIDFISTTLALVIGFMTNLLLTYFTFIVGFFASLPFAWEYVGEKSWLFWVGYYFVLAGALLFFSKKASNRFD